MNYKVIYVCYSNKGRSPAFEAYTKHFLSEKGIEDITVLSAGVGTARMDQLRVEGHSSASKVTRQILAQQGLNIDDHKITNLENVIKGADLILVTDQDVLDTIRNDFSHYAGRAMLAGEYAGSKMYKEVHGPHWSGRGPIKSEVEGYKRMIVEIKYLTRKVVKRMIAERGEGKLSRRKGSEE